MESRVNLSKKKRKEVKEEVLIKKRIRLKKKFKLAIFIIVFAIISTVLYARFFEPFQLQIKEYKVETSNDISENFNGLKIAHFSDLHYGSSVSENELINVVKSINNLEPDIVVFTGDLIDEKAKTTSSDKSKLIEELSKIDSNLGKYAIRGNHDLNTLEFDSIMQSAEFMVLNNTYDLIYNMDNNPILIFGFDDTINGNPNYEEMLNEETISIPYKIILVHEPDYIDEFKDAFKTDLVLAGHSHGGQVKLPLVTSLFLPLGCKNYYKSYYNVNDTNLYISNGIGTSMLKIRLNSIPSINLYRLVKIK